MMTFNVPPERNADLQPLGLPRVWQVDGRMGDEEEEDGGLVPHQYFCNVEQYCILSLKSVTKAGHMR